MIYSFFSLVTVPEIQTLKFSSGCTKIITTWEFLLDQTNKTDNGGTAAPVLLIILVNGVFSQDGGLNFMGIRDLELLSFMFMKNSTLIKAEIINHITANSNCF